MNTASVFPLDVWAKSEMEPGSDECLGWEMLRECFMSEKKEPWDRHKLGCLAEAKAHTARNSTQKAQWEGHPSGKVKNRVWNMNLESPLQHTVALTCAQLLCSIPFHNRRKEWRRGQEGCKGLTFNWTPSRSTWGMQWLPDGVLGSRDLGFGKIIWSSPEEVKTFLKSFELP